MKFLTGEAVTLAGMADDLDAALRAERLAVVEQIRLRGWDAVGRFTGQMLPMSRFNIILDEVAGLTGEEQER